MANEPQALQSRRVYPQSWARVRHVHAADAYAQKKHLNYAFEMRKNARLHSKNVRARHFRQLHAYAFCKVRPFRLK